MSLCLTFDNTSHLVHIDEYNLTVVLPSSYRIFVGLLLALLLCNTSFGSTIRLVAIGDSLTAGYGLPVEDGFVTQLENALKARSFDVQIINAGVSGDTTSGSLARIDWVLTDEYSGVILHLGHNDAFRGIAVEQVRSNMDRLIANIKQRGLPIVMSGAMAPRNLGPDYYLEFDSIFPDLAEKYDLIFYPFFLDGVATDPSLNQGDGIHPNKAGVAFIVERIVPYVEQLIHQVSE